MEQEYIYYTEDNGEINVILHGDDLDIERAHIGCWLYIWLDRVSEGLRITVPEKAKGKTVEYIFIDIQRHEGQPFRELGFPLIEFLYIPSGVRQMDFRMINYDLLKGIDIEINPDNPNFRVYDGNFYSGDMKKLLYIFSAKECLRVPDGVEEIGEWAGRRLGGLKKLVVPKSVKIIDDSAFEYCRDLEDIEIAAENIGLYAFYKCYALTRARLNSRNINDEAFSGCTGLKSLELMNIETIRDEAFMDCRSLAEVKLPDTLQKLESSVFFGSDIRDLVIPPSVRSLGVSLFGGGISKTSMNLTVYSDNGKVFFKTEGDLVLTGMMITVRSLQTDETLFKFVWLTLLDPFFTERGFDFTEYDDLFKDPTKSNNVKIMFEAAVTRLAYPYKMNEGTKDVYRNYITEYAGRFLSIKIKDEEMSAEEAAEFPYLGLISDKELMEIIKETAKEGKAEITAVLMREMNKRRDCG